MQKKYFEHKQRHKHQKNIAQRSHCTYKYFSQEVFFRNSTLQKNILIKKPKYKIMPTIFFFSEVPLQEALFAKIIGTKKQFAKKIFVSYVTGWGKHYTIEYREKLLFLGDWKHPWLSKDNFKHFRLHSRDFLRHCSAVLQAMSKCPWPC